MRSLLCSLGWIGLLLPLCAQPLSDGVFVLKDLIADWQTGEVSDTLTPTTVRTVRSGGVAMRAGALHPTQKPARIAFTLTLPKVDPGDRLLVSAWVGVDDDAQRNEPKHPHDGVRARLWVETQVLAQVDCVSEGWQPLFADLTSFAGKTARLAFEIDPLGNTHSDWAYIAEARVLRLRERFAESVHSQLPPEGVLEVRGMPGDRFQIDAPGHAPIRATIPENGILWLRYAFAGARHASLTELQRESSARVYRLQPRLRFKSVSTTRAVYAPGEVAECAAIIENAGQGTWVGAVQISVRVLQEMQVLSAPQVGEVLIPPDGSHTVRFRVRVGTRPQAIVMMRSAQGNDGVVLRPNVSPLPTGVPNEGSFARRFGDSWVLQNESLRLVFAPAFPQGYTARLFHRFEEGWVLIATTPALAEAVLNAENAPPKTARFVPESITPSDGSLTLVLQGVVGLVGRATLSYRLVGNRVECTARLTSTRDAHLYRFVFPDWRVGDGSFGGQKDEALFPGLEYLLDGEPSSDSRFAEPPYDVRFSPHPYKITVPLMAVRWRNWLITMSWNPEGGWSGVLRAPNALFASPNRLEAGEHHRFALWVPTIPQWADENSLIAREPFRLIKDDSVLLSATLSVRTDAEDVVQAIADYLLEHGMPMPPAPQRTDFQALGLTVQGLLNSYDSQAKAWRHTNTGPTFYDPQVALALWVLGHRLYPEDTRRRLAIQQVREAVSAQARENIGLELAFYIGGLPHVLDAWGSVIASLRKAQRRDGSWSWQPETPRHEVLGKAGETSSGWTGERGAQVGKHARMTLNPASQESLLQAVRYLMRQRRPEGAQTWELPLHMPDLLAVPYAIHTLLDAYLLTEEARYLEQAERWTLRGVPFVYLWSAPDRPIMRGATVPAFGVTWRSQPPWFGIAVQWNGLVYANALYRLAQVIENPRLEWRRLADAITLCAVQQQEWTLGRYPAEEGMYLSALSIVKGAEAYRGNLNPRLLAPCIAQRLRFDIEPRTHIVKHGLRKIACTAPGLQSVQVEDSRINLYIASPVSELPAIFLYVAGIREVRAVRVNGEPIGFVEDMNPYLWELERARSGWQVYKDGVLVRVLNPTDTLTVEVEF